MVAICVEGNPQPFAVGRLSTDARHRHQIGPGTKGVGVEIWNTYGDDLWRHQYSIDFEKRPSSPPIDKILYLYLHTHTQPHISSHTEQKRSRDDHRNSNRNSSNLPNKLDSIHCVIQIIHSFNDHPDHHNVVYRKYFFYFEFHNDNDDVDDLYDSSSRCQ